MQFAVASRPASANRVLILDNEYLRALQLTALLKNMDR